MKHAKKYHISIFDYESHNSWHTVELTVLNINYVLNWSFIKVLIKTKKVFVFSSGENGHKNYPSALGSDKNIIRNE